MKCTLVFTLLATLLASSLAAPLELSDFFAIDTQPAKGVDVVKRQVHANPDAELKQISFQGLIGDLENSLFQSALSVQGASAPDSVVSEVTPEVGHGITKRSNEFAPATDSPAEEDAQARQILLQTTKKVPESGDGIPAHFIIDRVSVQPHVSGSVPLIPTFQVHHTKLISATIKEDSNNDGNPDGKQTKISITKTSITSTAPVESVETPNTSSTTKTEQVSTTSSPATTTTEKKQEKETSSSSSTSTTSTTTEAPSQKLKKDEEKLKEKVAEVEADPIILSSRL